MDDVAPQIEVFNRINLREIYFQGVQRVVNLMNGSRNRRTGGRIVGRRGNAGSARKKDCPALTKLQCGPTLALCSL